MKTGIEKRISNSDNRACDHSLPAVRQKYIVLNEASYSAWIRGALVGNLRIGC